MNTRRSGFTMLELIMVIAIIGVLAALAIPQYVSFVEKARAAEALNYIGMIKSAQIVYAIQSSKGIYGASLSVIGLTASSTPLWSFSTVGSGSTGFTATATRLGTGPQAGKNIILTYTPAGGGTWDTSTHPGAPKQ